MNKLLIYRKKGGLGDIFMHRMLFEDIKNSGYSITFACPERYHEAVIDHPYIEKVIDYNNVNHSSYDTIRNTSFVCNRYELRKAPFIDKHRSDIWAEHCGFNLTNHSMHFRIDEQEKDWAKRQITKETILLAPISAMAGKSLDIKQVLDLTKELPDYDIIVLHDKPLPIPCRQYPDISIKKFIALISEVHFVVSVDTAALHCAGGLDKPMVGIFSFTDGLIYGKYYPKMILVQKHRNYTPGWTCGPCHDFTKCPKIPDMRIMRKPCITEIATEDILDGIRKMENTYPYAKRDIPATNR